MQSSVRPCVHLDGFTNNIHKGLNFKNLETCSPILGYEKLSVYENDG